VLTHHHVASVSRVVLLGAGGFISPYLQQRLTAAKIPWIAISSREIDLAQENSGERLAAKLLATDTVVMLSCLAPDKGRDYLALMVNLRMAASVCEALLLKPCAHFIYLSSDAVYDASKIPLDEYSSREPVDLYALMHTSREMMLGDVLAKLGTPLAILRPSSIYGWGDTHNSYGPNRFLRSALQEKKIILFGRGEEKRSHIYVHDAVELIARVIEQRSAGQLNLVVRPTRSYAEMAAVVQSIFTEPIQLEYRPRTVLPIHRPYQPTQIFRYVYNLGRKIGPIVHRPYLNSAIFSAFPTFRFTPMKEAITNIKTRLEAESASVIPTTTNLAS
jgi:UDP-glucose 4-epimerase